MNSKNTVRNEQIAKISYTSLLASIIIFMTFVDPFGYIRIGAVPITIIHIPVLVGSIILGRKYGLILGLVFGLGSMTRSFIEYSLYAPFTNPLLSVVPRMFIGFIGYDVYRFFERIFKGKLSDKINNGLSIPLALGIMTFIHSIIVLPLLYLIGMSGFHFFANEYVFGVNANLFKFMWLVFVSNSFIEIALAVAIGTPIVIALKQMMKNRLY